MNTVVYYPHLYPSPDWMKLAALCWDEIYRLKPKSSKDPEFISEIDEQLGSVLKTVDVAAAVKADFVLRNKFTGWMKDRLRVFDSEMAWEPYDFEFTPFSEGKMEFDSRNYLVAAGLARIVAGKDRKRVAKWEAQSYLMPRNAPPFATREELIEIVPELAKFTLSREEKTAAAQYEQLVEQMEEARYGENNREKAKTLKQRAEAIRQKHLVTIEIPETMFLLRNDVAFHYLSLVASQVALEKNRDLFAADGIYKDVVFHDSRSIGAEVSTSVMEAYLPRDLSKLDPARIADIRRAQSSNRLKYQKAIQSVVEEFSKVASEGTLKTVKKQILDVAVERAEETKKCYRMFKADAVLRTMGLTLTPPALVTGLASALGIGIFAPAAIGAAIAAFSAKMLLDREKAQSEKAKSPWSYALDMADRLKA